MKKIFSISLFIGIFACLAAILLPALLNSAIAGAPLSFRPALPSPPDDDRQVQSGVQPQPEGIAGLKPEVISEPSGGEAIDAVWPGPDGFTYFGSEVNYQWVDIQSSGTLISGLTDDSFAGPFQLNFTFPFYGANFSQFYVTDNGYLSFGSGSNAYENQCPLPDSTSPNNIIAAHWDDFIPNYTSGGVYYQFFSTCPVGSGSCTVLSYINWTHLSGNAGDAGTWQTILYPSGEIRMKYLYAGIEAGSSATIGIEGNNAASNHGLTLGCNAVSAIYGKLAISYFPYPQGLFLLPDATSSPACSAGSQSYTLRLFNNTNSSVTASLSYAITSGSGSLTGSPSINLNQGTSATFKVNMTPNGSAGQQVVGRVTASGNGFSDQTFITQTISGSSFWRQLPNEPDSGRMDNAVGAGNSKIWSVTGHGLNANVRSYDPATDLWTTNGTAPSFGDNYARSGCSSGNKVYVYGDAVTSNFTGLWSYNLSTGAWVNETPSGTPPSQTGIWAPAWVQDAATGYCYLTGGATTSGTGDLASVYIYNPGTNAWLAPLPNFSTVRDFHAAFIYTRPSDSHKLLCVAGGSTTNSVRLSSTQCYDFTNTAWSAENATIGALPATWWAMSYAQKTLNGVPQLWLVAGVRADSRTDTSAYYDASVGSWQAGPTLPSAQVYRSSATTLNNDIYHLGGSTSSFSYVGLTDRLFQCSAGTSTDTPTPTRTNTPTPTRTNTPTPTRTNTPTPTQTLTPAAGNGKAYLPLQRLDYISYFEGPWESEPNNKLSEANGPLRLNQDYFGKPDVYWDIFAITLFSSSNLTIDLTGHVGSDVFFDLYRINPDGSLGSLLVSDSTGPDYQLKYPAQPGSYYITIYTGSVYTNPPLYVLRVNAP